MRLRVQWQQVLSQGVEEKEMKKGFCLGGGGGGGGGFIINLPYDCRYNRLKWYTSKRVPYKSREISNTTVWLIHQSLVASKMVSQGTYCWIERIEWHSYLVTHPHR